MLTKESQMLTKESQMNAKIRPLVFLCALAVCITPIGVLANEVALADEAISPYELSFKPYNADGQHILRVSCNSGEYFQEQFAAGEEPLFQAVDKAGFALADGGCSYELRAIPATEGMEAQDGQGYVQFGTLDISQGMIAERADSAAHSQN